MGYRNGNSTYYKSTVKKALEKYRPQTIYLIIGLMIGSIYAIIIGVTTLKVPQAPLSFSTFSIVYFIIGGLVILGMEVCRRLRAKKNTPIIMLTAKGDITDKVKGLDVEADDYLTKPFEIEELLARMRVILRRKTQNTNQSKIIEVADLKLDLEKKQVSRNGKNIELTRKEYELLEYLMKNNGIVISREKIIETVWDYDFVGDTKKVDVFIRYLRSKIGDGYDKKLINTVRGFRYFIQE